MNSDLKDDLIERYFANAALKQMLGEDRVTNLLISVGHILDLLESDSAVFRDRLSITRTTTNVPRRTLYVVDAYIPEEGLHTVFVATIREEAIQFDTFEDGDWVQDIIQWEAAAVAGPFGEVHRG